jgi:hypothetical protein
MELEERAAQPLAGGIVQHGYQCGMLWGAALAAGAEAHRRYGTGPEAEARAVLAARRLSDAFRAQNGHTDCSDITGLDDGSSTWKMLRVFLIQGQAVGCFRMAARYAPIALREIEAAMAEPDVEAPPAPASCAALLARRMGASDRHAVMAAGLAGGIGLRGGCCGALGAAIWLDGMKLLPAGSKVASRSPGALAAIGRLRACVGDELECTRIAGRRFESLGDHAGWLREGGCAKVLEALAAR